MDCWWNLLVDLSTSVIWQKSTMAHLSYHQRFRSCSAGASWSLSSGYSVVRMMARDLLGTTWPSPVRHALLSAGFRSAWTYDIRRSQMGGEKFGGVQRLRGKLGQHSSSIHIARNWSWWIVWCLGSITWFICRKRSPVHDSIIILFFSEYMFRMCPYDFGMKFFGFSSLEFPHCLDLVEQGL